MGRNSWALIIHTLPGRQLFQEFIGNNLPILPQYTALISIDGISRLSWITRQLIFPNMTPLEAKYNLALRKCPNHPLEITAQVIFLTQEIIFQKF
jgi:hypothetical protein